MKPVVPALMLAAAAPLAVAQTPPAPACSARSAERAPPVVELYTSEGCNSCPPADRWLSALKRDPAVVALAFHVDYWDRLGWPDRFASAAHTRRQAEQRAVNGAPFSYTPQVVMQGVDRPDWRHGALPARPPGRAPVDIALEGDARGLTAQVSPRAGPPVRLAAYWAVTEDGHASAVKAGENAGEHLRHDFVVREFVSVPAWSGATTLSFAPARAADAAHPRSISLVVVDAATGRPVQAVRVGC